MNTPGDFDCLPCRVGAVAFFVVLILGLYLSVLGLGSKTAWFKLALMVCIIVGASFHVLRKWNGKTKKNR